MRISPSNPRRPVAPVASPAASRQSQSPTKRGGGRQGGEGGAGFMSWLLWPRTEEIVGLSRGMGCMNMKQGTEVVFRHCCLCLEGGMLL